MENWAMSVQTVREAGFFTTLTPLDNALHMVAIKDIGETCVSELLAAGKVLPANPYVFELSGPRAYTSVDVQKAFEAVSGKSVEMRPVEKAGLADFYGAVFPPAVAKEYVEMNESYLPGGIMYENPNPTGEIQYGKTDLVDAIKAMYRA
ncbi:hypothetical protein VTK56DRAFT_4463 [Thermocarpiscus australiensis]